ncbi:MAG TPA: hypothetical protein VNL18_07330 [Gemmatimonadales bacterium]|nr:hypothetical protein [Gemmatimonadales bacterium]
MPTAPKSREPATGDWRYELWTRTKEALLSLPGYFLAPDIRVAGIYATEVFTLGATLGATIEDQVVTTLNRMRRVWDPADKYPLYTFVRQPQTFPDVLLMQPGETTGKQNIAFGIELKGWCLLAKEQEPSYRYKVTPAACTDWDLLAVVPWHLSDVISGTPRVLAPWIAPARHAAEYRNYWWQHLRKTKASTEIRSPKGATPYPSARDKVLDDPVSDAGNNFGRIARTGLMDEYKNLVFESLIAGIPAKYWWEFLKAFQQKPDPARIAAALKNMGKAQKDANAKLASRIARRVLLMLRDAE